MAASVSCVCQGLVPSRAGEQQLAQSLVRNPVVVSFPLRRSCRAVAENARGISCGAGSGEKVGIFGRLGRVIKEKEKGDIDRSFSGCSKTREKLSVVDEVLTYWNLSDSETVLDELEEALLGSDCGPRTTLKIVDELRKEILAGKLKTGPKIKGGGKITTICMSIPVEQNLASDMGKLGHSCKKIEDTKVLMAAGDNFEAAASEQLEVWAHRYAVAQSAAYLPSVPTCSERLRCFGLCGVVLRGRLPSFQRADSRRYKRRGIPVVPAIGGQPGNQSTFLSYEEAGLIEMSKLDMHERFLCRLTVSSLNLLRIISEQEGVPIEELNAGLICDWFQKDKIKREQDLSSATLKWDSEPEW